MFSKPCSIIKRVKLGVEITTNVIFSNYPDTIVAQLQGVIEADEQALAQLEIDRDIAAQAKETAP